MTINKLHLMGTVLFLLTSHCFSDDLEGSWMSEMPRFNSFFGHYRVGLDVGKKHMAIQAIFLETSGNEPKRLLTPASARSNFSVSKKVVVGSSTIFSCATQTGEFFLVRRGASLLVLSKNGEFSDYLIKREIGADEALKDFVEGMKIEAEMSSLIHSE